MGAGQSSANLCDDPSERPRPRPSSAPGHAKKVACEPGEAPTDAAKYGAQGDRPQTAGSGVQRLQNNRRQTKKHIPNATRMLVHKVEWWCEHLKERAMLEVPYDILLNCITITI